MTATGTVGLSNLKVKAVQLGAKGVAPIRAADTTDSWAFD
jgi:hypothetical protein